MEGKTKLIIWRIFVRTLAAGTLSILIYYALLAIGISSVPSLAVSGALFLCGVTYLIIRSNEKRVSIIFIGLGFSTQALAEPALKQVGMSPEGAAIVANILMVAIIITGFLAAGRLAGLIWRKVPPVS